MNKLILFLTVSILATACYTETKKPDYKFMNTVKRQALLDTSLKTTILITPKKYYYGGIPTAKKLEGSFYVKNIGNKDFNIISIKSNCDCIKTSYPDMKIIHPNDSLKINYEMNATNIKGVFKNSIIAIGNCQYGNQTYYFEGTIY